MISVALLLILVALYLVTRRKIQAITADRDRWRRIAESSKAHIEHLRSKLRTYDFEDRRDFWDRILDEETHRRITQGTR